jgi:hypothetical protein
VTVIVCVCLCMTVCCVYHLCDILAHTHKHTHAP